MVDFSFSALNAPSPPPLAQSQTLTLNVKGQCAQRPPSLLITDDVDAVTASNCEGAAMVSDFLAPACALRWAEGKECFEMHRDQPTTVIAALYQITAMDQGNRGHELADKRRFNRDASRIWHVFGQ